MDIKKEGSITKYFATGNVPSLKNGKVKTKWGLIPSKTVRRYMKENSDQWFDEEFKKSFLEDLEGKDFPIRLHMYFVRDSRRRADYVNIAQICLDLLVKANLLPDDNMDYLVPVFDGYEINKTNPGVEFWVE